MAEPITSSESKKDIIKIFDSKCFRCEHIRCVDFFRKLDELEGNELFVLATTINSGKIVPCITGDCIYCLCKFALALSKNYANAPIYIVLLQCIRDLKCSTFLAFCGHYRNAIQILRTVLENFLVGTYFKYLEDPDAFEKWIEGTYEIPTSLHQEVYGRKLRPKKLLDYGFLLEFLCKRNILLPEMKTWIESKIINPLNRYLHPYFPSFEISKEWGEHSSCPAAVKFNEEKLKEWLDLFQRINWFVIEGLFNIFSYEYFESDEDAREGMDMLIVAPDIVPKFIRSEKYRKLVNDLYQRFQSRQQELEKIQKA